MEAQRAANELRAVIDGGRLQEVRARRKRARLRVSEASVLLKERWKDKLTAGELRAKTLEGYKNGLKPFEALFGKKMLNEITKEDMVDYRNELAHTRSNVSANRSLFVVKQLFKIGLEEGSITEDVAGNIRYLSEKEHSRTKFLLPTKLEDLIKACESTKAKYYMPALIALGSEHGVSKQEALSLCWADIDSDYEGVGLITFYRTKNGARRTQHLMPRTRKYLLKWREHVKLMRRKKGINQISSDFVFSRLDGEPIKRFDKAWRHVCKTAGLVNFHYHDLRHTYCSNLLLSGTDMKLASGMIGHKYESMTDRYSHIPSAYHRLAQERLAQHYAHDSSLVE